MANFFRVTITHWGKGCPPYVDGFEAAFTSYPAAKRTVEDCSKKDLRYLVEAFPEEKSFFEIEEKGKHSALIKKREGDHYVPMTAYDIYEVEEMTAEFPWWKYRGYNITSDGKREEYVVEKYDVSIIARENNIADALTAIDRDILNVTPASAIGCSKTTKKPVAEGSFLSDVLFSDWELNGIKCESVDWKNRVFVFVMNETRYTFDENDAEHMTSVQQQVIASLVAHVTKKALEKFICKRPVCGEDDQDYITCPTCGYALESVDSGEYAVEQPFCPMCAQAIKWH